MVLQNKNILLGISGGIAAYKCAHLVRLFVKEGANVRVVMTEASRQFVTKETLSVLSKNEVVSDFFDTQSNWNNHVHLAEWADLMVIAPATANTLAKFAGGICDNLLSAIYLSARSKVYIAPAMDLDMYKHPTTKTNLDILVKNGNLIIPAESGELASGLTGEGRMAEPENIVSFIKSDLLKSLPLIGLNVLVNAGPTYEAIDPVRFIGNRSSGKTGIAIADEFAARGATVTLVLGPSAFRPKNKQVNVIAVESAQQMFDATVNAYPNTDIAILTAAVADYKPTEQSDKKIKKSSEELTLTLTKTKDILGHLGQIKNKQFLVGFALETHDAINYAKEKLNKKNLDLVVVNTTSENNPAFGSDNNEVSFIDKHNKITKFEFKSKQEIAKDLVNQICTYIGK